MQEAKIVGYVEAAQQGEFDVLVVTEYSRLSRQLVELAVVITLLQQHEVQIESVTEPFEDSAVGHFLRSVSAFVAEVEREKISSRSRKGWKERAATDHAGQGLAMYGYTALDPDGDSKVRYLPNHEVMYLDRDGLEWSEVKVVRYMFELALNVRRSSPPRYRRNRPNRPDKPFYGQSLRV